MKKVLTNILFILLFSGAAFGQKVEVESYEMPISKKARKFGQYSGSYWDENKEQLQTLYTYREKRKSPRSYDLVSINEKGKVTGPKTDLFKPENVSQFDLQIDETILEEEEFENFNQQMVWFKRVDLGWNAIAYDGYFEPVSDIFGFKGYRFEKGSDKTLLMGKTNQSLQLDFVLADGPIVEKYSSKVLEQGILGLSSLATYAFIPKGDKVIVGGLASGRVKIGLDASPDWLQTRYLVGTYDTENMQWVDQNFIEFDHTMHSLASLKTEDGAAVLLRKDTKGTIEDNRVHFKNSEYKGVTMLQFDNKGKLLSQVELDLVGFNFPPLQGIANIVPPKFELRKFGESYIITAISYGKGTQFEALNIFKVTGDKVVFAKKFTAEDLNDFDVAKGEKVKAFIKKREVPEISEVIELESEILLLGKVKEIGDFIIRMDSKTGDKKQMLASAPWTPKQGVNIPLGVRGWSKTKSSRASEGFFDYPVTVQQQGDWYYILYRKMNAGMTPGSTVSSSYSTDYATYTKYVKIDEVFAFGKLIMINKKTGAVTEPVVIDDEILVGAYGMYLGKDGQVYLHGYDGKKYQMTTVTIK
ncbi:MAG: hypothetical protein ABJN36_18375 [Cyclobacteriaceae bacterium]